jgi:hypothetical protein
VLARRAGLRLIHGMQNGLHLYRYVARLPFWLIRAARASDDDPMRPPLDDTQGTLIESRERRNPLTLETRYGKRHDAGYPASLLMVKRGSVQRSV